MFYSPDLVAVGSARKVSHALYIEVSAYLIGVERRTLVRLRSRGSKIETLV